MPEDKNEPDEFELGVTTIMRTKNLGQKILAMEIGGQTDTEAHRKAVENFSELSLSLEVLELTSPKDIFAAMHDEAQRRITESLRQNGGGDA